MVEAAMVEPRDRRLAWPRSLVTGAFAIAVLVSGCNDSPSGTTTSPPALTVDPAKKPVLRFSAIPDQNTTELQRKFDPVAVYLASKLGVKVEYVPAVDYQASVEMFKNGDIQLAWFGGLTGVQARHAVEGATAIAQGAEDPKFYSYFIAHADTGLQRSDEFPKGIEGRSFAFGSESSTSGRLMPEHFIKTLGGKAPTAMFRSVAYSGSHDKTAELVQAGQVEVGALNYKVYERRVKAGTTDPAKARIIWQTPPYADYNFTAHPDLETMFGVGFVDKLRQALDTMNEPALLAAFPRKALIPAHSKDFEGIAQVARALGMLR